MRGNVRLPSIFLSNLRSIHNKFDDFLCQISCHNPDIVICTETWLNSNSPIAAFNVPGFSCFRKDRPNDARGGGVAIWVNGRSFCGEELNLAVFDCVDVCFVRLTNVKLLICGVYLPPGLHTEVFKKFQDVLESVLDVFLISFPHDRLIIAGDFNRYDVSFLQLRFSLKNIVSGPTRFNACLDHIYVDKELLPKYNKDLVEIGPPIGSSDHKSVFIPSGNVRRKHSEETPCLRFPENSRIGF